ncbi:MAG: U32 family peptidase [Armatimonadetes bacterium]|nr:U32 family peptidase [Armatimonadota bacterium]
MNAPELLKSLGWPTGDANDLPASAKRFPDGGSWRFEIPSVEGPRVLEAVITEAQRLKVPLHRISQGSGIRMLTDLEVLEMGRLCRDAKLELCLFVTPRAVYDTGAARPGWQLRGMDAIRHCLDDIQRAVELGIRGILVADFGLLHVVGRLKAAGALPGDLAVKISVLMGATNPVNIRLMQELGASTVNLCTDLSLAHIATIRQVVDIPLDLYVEAPDGLGGFVRFFETPELVRVGAPMYVKLGVSNAANIYPAGLHIEVLAVNEGRERVHRARLVYEQMVRHGADGSMSKVGAADLAVPVAV